MTVISYQVRWCLVAKLLLIQNWVSSLGYEIFCKSRYRLISLKAEIDKRHRKSRSKIQRTKQKFMYIRTIIFFFLITKIIDKCDIIELFCD